MGRAKGDPELAKLKKQLRNDQYGSNNGAAQKKREKDKLYRQKKREQEHLQLHRDPLAQLADIITQQDYLQDVTMTELPIVPEHTEEQEAIDTGLIVEEEGEILEIFGKDVSEELDDSGFLDGMEDEDEVIVVPLTEDHESRCQLDEDFFNEFFPEQTNRNNGNPIAIMLIVESELEEEEEEEEDSLSEESSGSEESDSDDNETGNDRYFEKTNG
jgi:hypothetical protein